LPILIVVHTTADSIRLFVFEWRFVLLLGITEVYELDVVVIVQ
jgi:hypothetical protein